MNEEWKEVKGYEGSYSVSNLGRVKSLPRKGRKSEKILNPYFREHAFIGVLFLFIYKILSFSIGKVLNNPRPPPSIYN